MTQKMYNFGFTPDTEIWCSAGFYKTIQQLMDKKEAFITDSFMEDDSAFITNVAHITPRGSKVVDLIEVTYGGAVSLGVDQTITVRCTPDQKFLTCYENNGTLHYKGNETFFWVEAKDLKEGIRLVAYDANIVVKSVRHLEEKADIYSVKIDGSEKNYSIRLGIIVEA